MLTIDQSPSNRPHHPLFHHDLPPPSMPSSTTNTAAAAQSTNHDLSGCHPGRRPVRIVARRRPCHRFPFSQSTSSNSNSTLATRQLSAVISKSLTHFCVCPAVKASRTALFAKTARYESHTNYYWYLLHTMHKNGACPSQQYERKFQTTLCRFLPSLRSATGLHRS
mmetsp:Transcript_10921/g.31311  ORF Transcript_10921/g.31311 Transcript_10921/m.31311 type:complete len:166 (-) Transcript_10921:802-1299(-)